MKGQRAAETAERLNDRFLGAGLANWTESVGAGGRLQGRRGRGGGGLRLGQSGGDLRLEFPFGWRLAAQRARRKVFFRLSGSARGAGSFAAPQPARHCRDRLNQASAGGGHGVELFEVGGAGHWIRSPGARLGRREEVRRGPAAASPAARAGASGSKLALRAGSSDRSGVGPKPAKHGKQRPDEGEPMRTGQFQSFPAVAEPTGESFRVYTPIVHKSTGY